MSILPQHQFPFSLVHGHVVGRDGGETLRLKNI